VILRVRNLRVVCVCVCVGQETKNTKDVVVWDGKNRGAVRSMKEREKKDMACMVFRESLFNKIAREIVREAIDFFPPWRRM